MSHIRDIDAEHSVLTGLGLGDLSIDAVRQIKQSGQPQLRVMPSKAQEEGDRIIRYVASDETPDRVGDIIKVSGWNLTPYKANPVVLWGHDSSATPPIGRAVNVRRGLGPDGREALLASIQFAPKEAYEFAETVYQLSKGGFLNAVSVGFLPRATEEISDKERQKLGMPSYGLMYSAADLLEISVVSVPANPSALVTGAKSLVHSGILRGREVDRFLKQVPMNEKELSARLKSKIRGFIDLGATAKGLETSDATEIAPELDESPSTPEDEAPKVAPDSVEPEPEPASESAPESAPEASAKSAALELERRHIEAVVETPSSIIVSYRKSDEEEPYDEPADMAGYRPSPDEMADEKALAVRALVEAQTEQTKAMTTLIDSISDLTKRIHLMGEVHSEAQRGCAKSSDAAASDSHADVLDEVDKLTNDFTQRLKRMRG